MPICEEYRKANFSLEILTWGNAGRGTSKRLFPRSKTHISPFYVHRTPLFEKKGGYESSGGPDAPSFENVSASFPYPTCFFIMG